VRARLLREVEHFFSEKTTGAPPGGIAAPPGGIGGVQEWIGNVTVHVEAGPPGGIGAPPVGIIGQGVAPGPNAWIYFPAFNGEREVLNGFCEDKSCECTGQLPACHKHPECKGKHLCKPWPAGRSKVRADRPCPT
jgi:hypothetical protein